MKKRIFIIAFLCLIAIATCVFLVAQRRGEIKHIVLISIDTCRADYLGCYGYPENTTPHIDALAESATRFAQVVTPVPITLPAHSTMLTGTIPPFHGVQHNGYPGLEPTNVTLAEILPDEFNSAAVLGSFVLDGKFGLSQGFDSYFDTFQNGNESKLDNERRGDEGSEIAIKWLEKNKNGRVFLFLHYYDPHMEYMPPEPYASAFPDDPYAGEIAFTDHCIGRVIQKLKDLGMYDSTLLIVTGDHGEMLGEHGEDGHSYFIYESAIKVPLIMKMPGQKQGVVIEQPVGLVDIVPTICSLLDIEVPAHVQGMDISGLLKGNVPDAYERYLYSESVTPTRIGASSLLAVSTDRWKYIRAPRPELYDIVADPAEQFNLIEEEPHRARILEDKLLEILEQNVRGSETNHVELDAESIRRLESLGYIAGKSEGQIVFDESKPDPKDFIDSYAQFQKALIYRDNKAYNKAVNILLDLIPILPEFTDIYVKLTEISMAQGKFTQAIRYCRSAYAQDPASINYQILNDLAWIQATRPSMGARDVDEAVKYAEDVCRRLDFKDPSALDTLAVAYAAAGDFERAVTVARRAVQQAYSLNQKQLALDISTRLELFEQSKPYIEDNPRKSGASKYLDFSQANSSADSACCP